MQKKEGNEDALIGIGITCEELMADLHRMELKEDKSSSA